MAADLNVQEAIADLRREVQEGFRTLSSNQQMIMDKIDGHKDDDAKEFKEIGERVAVVETRQKILFGSIGAILLAALGIVAKAFGG